MLPIISWVTGIQFSRSESGQNKHNFRFFKYLYLEQFLSKKIWHFWEVIGGLLKTHWKLLGVPISALVTLFFLILVLSLWFQKLRPLMPWYGCLGMWWNWRLWISGFLMSTVAMWITGHAGTAEHDGAEYKFHKLSTHKLEKINCNIR